MEAKRIRTGCRNALSVALAALLCVAMTSAPAVAAGDEPSSRVQAEQTELTEQTEPAEQVESAESTEPVEQTQGQDGQQGQAAGDQEGAPEALVVGESQERSGDRIVVASGTRHETLRDATIDQRGTEEPAIEVRRGATLELTVEGTNTLYGGDTQPAILVENGGTLIVRGAGTLNAFGGYGAPAIGGDGIDRYCGSVELRQTGTLNLTAGDGGAPALGNMGSGAAKTGNVAIYAGTVNLASPDASTDIAVRYVVMGGGSVSFSQKVPQGMRLPSGGETAARVELRGLPAGVNLTQATFSPSLGVSFVSDPQWADSALSTAWFNVDGFGAPTNGDSVVVFAPVSKLQSNTLITMTAGGAEYSGSLIGSASDGFVLTLVKHQVVNNPRIDISKVPSGASVQFATTSAGERQYSTDSGVTWTGYTGTPVLTGTDVRSAAPRDGARVIIQSGSHSLRLQNYRSNLDASYDPSACGLVVKNGANATVAVIGSNEILSAYDRAIRLGAASTSAR